MEYVLLDTIFVDYFSKKVPKDMNGKMLLIPIGALIELTSDGFSKKSEDIDNFIRREDVRLLGEVFPLEEEFLNYPLNLKIENYFLEKPNSLEDLRKSKSFLAALEYFYMCREIMGEKLKLMKPELEKKDVNFEVPENYRSYIKACLKRKAKRPKIKIKHLPFNTFFRCFLREKFLIKNYEYKMNDANDLLICLLSVYVDYFFVEEKNYGTIQKIKYKCGFSDIFKDEMKMFIFQDYKKMILEEEK